MPLRLDAFRADDLPATAALDNEHAAAEPFIPDVTADLQMLVFRA